MFNELQSELTKMEASVRRAFIDVEARIAAERARITKIDAGLIASLDRVEGIAKKAESTVRGRLTDLRSTVDRLTK